MKNIKPENIEQVNIIVHKTIKNIKKLEPKSEVKEVTKQLSEENLKSSSDSITSMEQARIMIDSNIREKSDGRMSGSFGKNLANEEPQVHFYPEDQEKLAELGRKGDKKGVHQLKKELIKQGKYYYT